MGWSEVEGNAEVPFSKVELRPWATIEGVVMHGEKPAAGQAVDLDPIVMADPRNRNYISSRAYFRYQATTNEKGQFKFERVVDGRFTLGAPRGNHASNLSVLPGEKVSGIGLGGVGRPVVGKMILPANLKVPGMWPPEARLELVRPEFIPPKNWESLKEEERQR